MVNSVGKRLQQARLGKQLSVEEAARVTRIRPDKLIDLEEDNYSNFPSMSYAKGFLLLYARFLGVDVRDFADTLHAPNPVSSDDYEYLNAASHLPPPAPTRRPYTPTPERKRTILPVIVFAVIVSGIVYVLYLFISFQRIVTKPGGQEAASPTESPAISTIASTGESAPAAATPAPPAVAVEVTPAIVAATPVASTPPPVPSPSPETAAASPAAAESPFASPAPAGTFDPTREVRRAEPVNPTPPDNTDASPAPNGSGPELAAIAPASTPGDLKQVAIVPIRKTKVTIRRDTPDSSPIFEDWLYPGDGPLKLTGHKFWIQVSDPNSIQVTQDGQPLPPGQSDIQIE